MAVLKIWNLSFESSIDIFIKKIKVFCCFVQQGTHKYMFDFMAHVSTSVFWDTNIRIYMLLRATITNQIEIQSNRQTDADALN